MFAKEESPRGERWGSQRTMDRGEIPREWDHDLSSGEGNLIMSAQQDYRTAAD